MKKQSIFIALTCICLSGSGQWDYVGPAGISNEWTVNNDIETDTGGNPVIIFFENSTLYKASCLRFNGSQWEQMGMSTFNSFPINQLLDFEIDNKNNYYILFLDSEYHTSCIKFNGDTWEFVGSQDISTEYSAFQSMTVDTAGVVYIAFESQSGFKILKENDKSWISVSTKGLSGVFHYFDLRFDIDNVAFFGYCGNNGKEPNCAKLVNDNWVSVGNADFSTLFASETHLLITKDHQIYLGFEHPSMGFYKFDNQTNKWVIVGTAGLGENFTGIRNLISDSNSNIHIVTSGDRPRCYAYNGASWYQLGDSGISESEAGYPKIAINKYGILYATYNDFNNGKAVVKKYIQSTDIENISFDYPVKIYPNPAEGVFIIESAGQEFDVLIYNSQGKMVYGKTNSMNQLEIDSNRFSKGIYIVKTGMGNKAFSYRRLIII